LSAALSARAAGLLGCHVCSLVSRPPPGVPAVLRCPRCRSVLHSRKRNSLARTWALLLAAMICYLPANLLPIMTVVNLGARQTDTILSGALFLLTEGMWPLALIVFVASI
jgi:paraquat-inducible protein A